MSQTVSRAAVLNGGWDSGSGHGVVGDADLGRFLDVLALWPDLDADAGAGWAGVDLDGFNDSV
ncbi:hypothetical protein [Streptomyces sp. NPDC097981]|uniref:hypothetical protein n=1 Tax=Streptomyces sp. NPDC097981 TaxID=3155428 RepID=UPI003327AB2A